MLPFFTRADYYLLIQVPITRSVSACYRRHTATAGRHWMEVQSNSPATCSPNHSLSYSNSAKTTCKFNLQLTIHLICMIRLICENVWHRPNTSDCPTATATGMTPPAPGLLSSAGRFDDNTGRFELTNGPQDDPPRLPFAGNNDLLTTTRRNSNFAWNSVIQQTTYRPWYAGSSNNNNNGVDSPKQQGLFSSACRTPGNGLILIIPVLFLPVLVWWLLSVFCICQCLNMSIITY